MLSHVFCATLVGLEGVRINVEVDVANRGFPTFTIVGLPDKAVEESKERVRTAIKNSSFDMPESRITVNMAPADIPKEGSLFDLSIAVGILSSQGLVDQKNLATSLFVGELSLDGKIQKVSGMLPIARLAKQEGLLDLYIPSENAPEASLVDGIQVYPVNTLGELVLHLNSQVRLAPFPRTKILDMHTYDDSQYDFSEIKGQEQAKRALEIASAGFHNIHLKGPPGGGKTLLARSFPSILPQMDDEEMIEVSTIYSILSRSHGSFLVRRRPFRAPHHTISRVGLVGGGSSLTPGEISLAHRGALFLDEFPEFPRSVLEALRQPLEDGVVTVSRAKGTLTFPSRFLLIAASNPCPCGFLGHPKKPCTCSSFQIIKYKKRISGPLLDRIDIHIHVPPVEEDKLTSPALSESSSVIRDRVEMARARQKDRLKKTGIKTNGEMSSSQVRKLCEMTERASSLLKHALSRLSISARTYFKLIKVARTIADLEGKDMIDETHIAEALQYRPHDE